MCYIIKKNNLNCNVSEFIEVELSEKKSKAQIYLLLGAARQVLSGMSGRKSPADRELVAFYRSNRQCGSRDRALINHCIYILLRHWGWVRKLAGGNVISSIESGSEGVANRDLAAMIFFALCCDGSDPDKSRRLADFIGVPLPPAPGAENAAEALGIKMQFSVSELLPRWTENLVPSGYAPGILKRPPVWLRVNRSCMERVTAELAEKNISFETVPEFPDALALNASSLNVMTLNTFKSGDFEIQDLASQAIASFCSPHKGERWFDPCAGAGGKTLALAEAMQRTGTVTAGDVRGKVLLELRKRARRSGYPNITVRQHDGRPWRGVKPFDGVLLDAPCSCSGVWRRNPGNPWICSPEDITRHAALQLDILKNFSSCVKPGGVLVYATCSAFREENEEVIGRFLDMDKRFEPVPYRNPFTGKSDSPFMHVPDDFNCDLMFAARLERKK